MNQGRENSVQRNFRATYFSLRWGVAALGLALILALPLAAWLYGDVPLRRSLSAYYHTVVRDEFVGILLAVGGLLVVYKGFTQLENWALNLAGVLLAGVAFFPTAADGGEGGWFSIHGTCAVLFFACIAYVAIFRASDTLSLISDLSARKRLAGLYRALGFLMLLSPAVAFMLSGLFRPGALVFFVEVCGVAAFSAYWIAKSLELQRTHAEKLAMAGRLRMQAYRVRDLLSPLLVERIEEELPPGREDAAASGR